jgi:hypothetical protein
LGTVAERTRCATVRVAAKDFRLENYSMIPINNCQKTGRVEQGMQSRVGAKNRQIARADSTKRQIMA